MRYGFRRFSTPVKVSCVALLTGVAACSDEVHAPQTAPGSPTYTALLAEGLPAQRAQQGDLARQVALALADANVRREVLESMRDAPVREHKLEFTGFLRTGRGVGLMTAMTRGSAAAQAAIESRIAALPRMEFYMPFEAHRQSWTGTDDVIVLSTIEDSEQPVAWDTRGNRVTIDPDKPSTAPALALVPVETDFSVVDPSLGRRRNASGATIQGPGVPAIDHGLEARNVIPIGAPNGLYITFQRLVDRGEPWYMGAPEIEVHVHGPTTPASPLYGADLACSGDRVDPPRGFNQDNAFWSGAALLFDDAQIAAAQANQPEGFHVMVWEDDNEKCKLNVDNLSLIDKITRVGTAVGGYTSVKTDSSGVVKILRAARFLANVFQSIQQSTRDDYLGLYVHQSVTGQAFTDANHILYRNGMEINGRAMLQLKQ